MGGGEERREVIEPAVELVQPPADRRRGPVCRAVVGPSIGLLVHPASVFKPTDLLHATDVLLLLLQP